VSLSTNKAKALSPATPGWELLKLARHYPREILRNPALDTLSLTDPEMWGLIMTVCKTRFVIDRLTRSAARFSAVSIETFRAEMDRLSISWSRSLAARALFRRVGWQRDVLVKAKQLVDGSVSGPEAVAEALPRYEHLAVLAAELAAQDVALGRRKLRSCSAEKVSALREQISEGRKKTP
jgi:hypothetical protein